jgi:hypothetical protein
MEKEQRNRLQKATQDARKLLEEEFRSQLLQTYDIDVEKVRWAEEPGAHLQAEQRLIREKLVAWIEHKEAQINDRKEALLLALREMAFTALNRFVALKLMEARELVRPCVSGGLESAGFLEFTAVAQGLLADQESSYRLYLETIFEDVSRELRALFDPRDPASLLWPKRAALLELLDILNRPELAELWIEDETLGWVYQYFNGNDVKEMREAVKGGAPRNSRELAVRNQFFTPRYVVEFLTDNTLGRIWHEMRQGKTGLKDRCRYLVRRPHEIWLQPGEEPPSQPDADAVLSQEELLHEPLHIPHRTLKDPREIRMLDPACGSMHFGLYAFDLYLEIYEEAWEIAKSSDDQVKQAEAFATFVIYAAEFASKEVFLREVPWLILLHNIHGVDIDPRATQIARLTLWLRAQRAWQEQGVEVATRPAITRSNVVCAEPMPGERGLLADFVDQQFPDAERGLVQQLLETIFDKMQLAGEAGSLLKIEEEVRDAVDQARREWQKLAIHQQNLFSRAELAVLGQLGGALNNDLQRLTTAFWVDIEERIYLALSRYAEQAERRGGYERRLFAEDAAQGFAFIDICRRKYDVALMNPPFGEASTKSADYLDRSYADWNSNLLCASLQRGWAWTAGSGCLGIIYDRTAIVKSTYEDFRRLALVGDDRIFVMADLGWEVLDANVEVVASAMHHSLKNGPSAGIFIDLRLIPSTEKAHSLQERLQHPETSNPEHRSTFCRGSELSKLPNAVVGYDFPSFLQRAFLGQKSIQAEGYKAYQGHALKAEKHFRVWWELGEATDKVFMRRLFNGARFSPYHTAHLDCVIAPCSLENLPKDSATVLRNTDKHGRSGVCFGKRGEFFCSHILPADFVFTVEGQAMPLEQPDKSLAALGFLNTPLIRSALNKYCGQHKYSGYVNLLPFSKADNPCGVASHVEQAIIKGAIARRLDEIQPCFCPLPRSRTLAEIVDSISSAIDSSREASLIAENFCQQQLLASFHVSPDEAEEITLFKNRQPIIESPIEDCDGHGECEWFAAHSEVSLAIGCVFGRWDIRYATGQKAAPELPDPFAALPVCPPGQLQDIDGLPASAGDVPTAYPIRIDWNGILVDDPNHPLDIDQRVREVIEIIWSNSDGAPTAETIEYEACRILGVSSFRDYCKKPTGFFADHLKRYSKSRRQAPVYWLLSAGGGSYSVWLYYHRFTFDTLYRVLRDFVEPRIQQAERDQLELESQGALSGDAATRLQEAQTLLQDLRNFKSELDLVAPLWNPNLNDGVIINHAILWRITPYTPWQKKCKECWDKLVKGDYDWAHLAFHLWPERVIPKCTIDRSLAIAHGLEERLWLETNNGNWLPRQLSDADLQALIAEHSNPAVKSALERFLAAPPPVAPTRTRASRSTRASGSSTPRRARGSAAVVDAEATRQVLLALTAAPSDGLAKTQIADLIGVEANALTAVIKQLKESGQIDQLGERRGARYVLSEQGRAAVASQAGEGD